jgi:hypothetical protein
MTAKPWQIVLIVASIVVCGFSIWWISSNDDSPKVNHILHYIDVETGDIYRVDISKANIGAPGRNPETGRMSLVRLDKKEAGGWYVNSRDRATIGQLDAGVKNTAVDERSGELTGPAKNAIEYVRKR